jgi:hypothetical protein
MVYGNLTHVDARLAKPSQRFSAQLIIAHAAHQGRDPTAQARVVRYVGARAPQELSIIEDVPQ